MRWVEHVPGVAKLLIVVRTVGTKKILLVSLSPTEANKRHFTQTTKEYK